MSLNSEQQQRMWEIIQAALHDPNRRTLTEEEIWEAAPDLEEMEQLEAEFEEWYANLTPEEHQEHADLSRIIRRKHLNLFLNESERRQDDEITEHFYKMLDDMGSKE